MENVFLKQFLMISDVRTIAFLAVLAALFYLIHVLYHKKHMDFAAVVMIGTGLGLVLGLAIQFVAGFPDKPMEVAFVAETTTWFAMFGSGYINLIKMIVVPLVMISIMQVIINMQQGSSMAKLVKKTLLVTMGMVAIASVTGIVIGTLFGVGKGAAIVEDGTATAACRCGVTSCRRWSTATSSASLSSPDSWVLRSGGSTMRARKRRSRYTT